ncbi:hypothetical protein E2C01_098125 [Portunus trituberculatus]|uniref:Uncharacterized protein n=1 Tax=Portunus trituberculatus TaxID=210409 RepID=A0A5B7K6U7_PORTR|nr:hypothetical protein [Portunus trituberculatus]
MAVNVQPLLSPPSLGRVPENGKISVKLGSGNVDYEKNGSNKGRRPGHSNLDCRREIMARVAVKQDAGEEGSGRVEVSGSVEEAETPNGYYVDTMGGVGTLVLTILHGNG